MLNSYLLNQLRLRKIKVFVLPSLIPFPMLFLSLCATEFLTHKIPSLWKTCLSSSCKASLVATSCLNSHLSEKVFTSPSHLKNNFSIFRILGWWRFSLKHFKYLTPLPFCVHSF